MASPRRTWRQLPDPPDRKDKTALRLGRHYAFKRRVLCMWALFDTIHTWVHVYGPTSGRHIPTGYKSVNDRWIFRTNSPKITEIPTTGPGHDRIRETLKICWISSAVKFARHMVLQPVSQYWVLCTVKLHGLHAVPDVRMRSTKKSEKRLYHTQSLVNILRIITTAYQVKPDTLVKNQ